MDVTDRYVVRLDALLSTLKLQPEAYWAPRLASSPWRRPGARGDSSVPSTPAPMVACRHVPPCYRWL